MILTKVNDDHIKLGVVAHAGSPSIQEVEAELL